MRLLGESLRSEFQALIAGHREGWVDEAAVSGAWTEVESLGAEVRTLWEFFEDLMTLEAWLNSGFPASSPWERRSTRGPMTNRERGNLLYGWQTPAAKVDSAVQSTEQPAAYSTNQGYDRAHGFGDLVRMFVSAPTYETGPMRETSRTTPDWPGSRISAETPAGGSLDRDLATRVTEQTTSEPLASATGALLESPVTTAAAASISNAVKTSRSHAGINGFEESASFEHSRLAAADLVEEGHPAGSMHPYLYLAEPNLKQVEQSRRDRIGPLEQSVVRDLHFRRSDPAGAEPHAARAYDSFGRQNPAPESSAEGRSFDDAATADPVDIVLEKLAREIRSSYRRFYGD